MNNKIAAQVGLLFVAIIWGLTFVLVKEALNDAPPFSFATLRFGLATILTMALVHRKLFKLTKNEMIKKLKKETSAFVLNQYMELHVLIQNQTNHRNPSQIHTNPSSIVEIHQKSKKSVKHHTNPSKILKIRKKS